MKINTVNTIEVSSVCNLACIYCPVRLQAKYRKVGLMSLETFQKCMLWVDECVRRGTQKEVNIFGLGEPLLNPDLVEMVQIARQHIGTRRLRFSTNGILLTPELAHELKEAGITDIGVSGHDPYHSAKAVQILRAEGIFDCLDQSAILTPHSWAGRVSWFESVRYPCPWVKGMCAIQWEGSISVCCMDAFAEGIIGQVDNINRFDEVDMKPYLRCQKCHQTLSTTYD